MRSNRNQRRLRMEALERREVLAAAVVSFTLLTDNDGQPGEQLRHVEKNQSFFVELAAEETHELYQGLGAVSVSMKWDPQRLQLDPDFDPNVAITNDLPFRHGKVDSDAGRIDDLSGAIFFNSGEPIGDAGPERFALLRFQAQDIAGPVALSLAEGPSGTVLYPMGTPTMFFDQRDILIVEPGFIDEPGSTANDDLVLVVNPPYVSDLVAETPANSEKPLDPAAEKPADEPAKADPTKALPDIVAILGRPGGSTATGDHANAQDPPSANPLGETTEAENPPAEIDLLNAPISPAIRSVQRLLKRITPVEVAQSPTFIPGRPGNALRPTNNGSPSPLASPTGLEHETFCVPSASWDAASLAVTELTVALGPSMPPWARPIRQQEPFRRLGNTRPTAPAIAPAPGGEIDDPIEAPTNENPDDVSILPVGPMEDFEPIDVPIETPTNENPDDISILPVGPMEDFEPIDASIETPTNENPDDVSILPVGPMEDFEPIDAPIETPTNENPDDISILPVGPMEDFEPINAPIETPTNENPDDISILPVGPMEDFEPIDEPIEAPTNENPDDISILPVGPMEDFKPIRRPLAAPAPSSPAATAITHESLTLRFRLISSLDDDLLTSLAESQLSHDRAA